MRLIIKLVLAFAAINILSLVSLVFIANYQIKKRIELRTQNFLTAIREIKQVNIQRFFTTIRKEGNTVARNPYVVESLKNLSLGLHCFAQEYQLGSKRLETRLALEKYYNHHQISADYCLDYDDNTIALQSAYLSSENSEDKAHTSYEKTHAQFYRYAQNLKNSLDLIDIYLVDNDGCLLFSVDKDINFAANITDTVIFDCHLAKLIRFLQKSNHRIDYFTDLQNYKFDRNRPAIFYGCPIFDGEERIGFLILRPSLDNLLAILSELASLSPFESTEIFFADSSGSLRFCSVHLDLHLPDYQSYHQGFSVENILEKIATGADSGLVVTGESTHKQFCAYSTFNLDDLSWILIAKIDVNEMHGDIRLIYRVTLHTTLFVIVGFLFLSGLISVWISKPINEAAHFARQIQAGDFSIQLPIHNNDEIGDLLGALNAMAQGIQEREKELLQAQQSAEQSLRAKSNFLANISHEIRTPLNAIVGFAELLQSETSTKSHYSETHKNFLGNIMTSGRVLLSLINDILDLSKIEADRLESKNETVNLRKIILEIKDIFLVMQEKKQVSLIIDICPDLPDYMVLDGIHIRQILLNLVGNAVKFTEQGSVTISVRAEVISDSCIDLTIDIEDTGIGIPVDQLENIFLAFRQQSGQSSRRYGGTGLGLTITKKLAALMGGEIRVQSAVDVGSCFTVFIPSVVIIPATALAPVAEDYLVQPPSWAKDSLSLIALSAGDILPLPNPSDYITRQVLLEKLQGEIWAKYLVVRQNSVIGQIDNFALELVSLGVNSRFTSLSLYGERLKMMVDAFDINAISTQLEKFPDLISSLKHE